MSSTYTNLKPGYETTTVFTDDLAPIEWIVNDMVVASSCKAGWNFYSKSYFVIAKQSPLSENDVQGILMKLPNLPLSYLVSLLTPLALIGLALRILLTPLYYTRRIQHAVLPCG
jgi:hypothetical protein